MFSPYYALARRLRPADPEEHCAINLALYRPRGSRWAMTERGRGALARRADELRVGPSRVAREGGDVVFEVDEITVPIPGRLRGQIRFRPTIATMSAFVLDGAGRHRWRPYAPLGRVEVTFDRPAMSWAGDAYLDGNDGDEPLESAFTSWHWMRSAGEHEALVHYDVLRRDQSRFSLALRFDHDGASPTAAPASVALPPTLWRVSREARSEGEARVVRTLEDAPFYARSLVETTLAGRRAVAVHESLSLTRFSQPIVQMMLPFRMPRRAGPKPHGA